MRCQAGLRIPQNENENENEYGIEMRKTEQMTNHQKSGNYKIGQIKQWIRIILLVLHAEYAVWTNQKYRWR